MNSVLYHSGFPRAVSAVSLRNRLPHRCPPRRCRLRRASPLRSNLLRFSLPWRSLPGSLLTGRSRPRSRLSDRPKCLHKRSQVRFHLQVSNLLPKLLARPDPRPPTLTVRFLPAFRRATRQTRRFQA